MRKGLTALAVCALLVVAFAQTAWAAAPSTCSCTPCTKVVHYVRWGENLWRISRWYGTTVEAIAQANGIVNPHCIYAGQRLVIPCGNVCKCPKPCDCNVPCPGCDDGDQNVPCPGCDDGDQNVPHPQPPDCGQTYVVKCGDTLSGIAWRYGVTVYCLTRANGIVNPHRIYKGQTIVIPCDCQYGHYKPKCGGPGWPKCGGYYPPRRAGFTYVVRYGDTLSGIAWRFGVNMWSIVHANGIANPNCIYAGQRLYIP